MTATKVKYEPRYKAGDWIVVHAGYAFDGTPRTTVMLALSDDKPRAYRYARHATDEEIAAKKAENEGRKQYEAYRNTQEYIDASSILCLDSETLIDKLGPEMLREIAEKLR